MRRAIMLMMCAFSLSLVLGGVAGAQTGTYPPNTGDSPAVEAGSGSRDGTAFTGSDTAFPTVAAGALLVVGSATLYLARRRARAFLGQ